MSEVLSRYAGFVTVARLSPPGMVTLKGDLDTAAVRGALEPVLGAALPGVRRVATGAGGQALWMAPDELLLLVPDAGATIAALEPRLAEGADTADTFVTLADVSDMRAMFALHGPRVPDALAKLAPVDFCDFPPGTLRRTRLAQVAAAIWRQDRDDWRLVCFRSVADYVAALLANAARPGGEPGLTR